MTPVYIFLLVSAIFTFGYQTRVWLEAMRRHENDVDMQSGLVRLNRKRITKQQAAKAKKDYRQGMIVLLFVLLSTCAHAQTMHADVSVGFSTRFRGVAATAITYQAYSGFETSLTALLENKHHLSVGGTVGLRAFTTSDWRADGVVMYAGAAYQWYGRAASSELKNDLRPVLGAKFMSSFGYFEVRYTGGTFTALFGHRLFNNNK